MSEAFASAWSLMKAPIYEPDFDLEPGFTVWDMPPHEEERQQQFNHLFPNYMKTPLQGETYGGWVGCLLDFKGRHGKRFCNNQPEQSSVPSSSTWSIKAQRCFLASF